MSNKITHLKLIGLHVAILIYSLSNVCSKLAAAEPFLSFHFCILYGAALILLGIYAYMWQQILKMLPLTVAFSNKAATVVWGLLWGKFIFSENITVGKLIGVLLVIAGVLLFVKEGGENESS